ncbi:thymidylate kinase [Candidatus Uhrbacteria bacterium]|nr:thymidylate kinase [Candidatus Uhrbacteria bacterium]
MEKTDSKKNRGLFLVIDGTDGSGKATQTKLLIERMGREGWPVETVSFPQYGQPSAGPVEDYLAGKYGAAETVGPKRASILFAVDRYAASAKIRQWLGEGKIVVADRYVASNMGHQGGKIADPTEREAYFRWNDDLEYGVFQIPRPDLNLILHVPCEITQGLLQERDGDRQDIHQADADHLKNAEKTYIQMAEMFPEMSLIRCCKGRKILTREEIHEMVWEKVEILSKR